MSELAHLPEYYVSADRQQIAAPTYEALSQCQIIMASAETGQTGPTLIEPGEHFTTEATPCQQWMPLNRAAGERFQEWLDSLPVAGADLTLEEISEAAHHMRPREGEKELPHEQWYAAVIEYAKRKRQKRQGLEVPKPRAGMVIRPGSHVPVMPYASQGASVPLDMGRSPTPERVAQHQPVPPQYASSQARRQRVTPPMPGTLPSQSPQQTAG